jgi:hypothetical protein
MSRSGPIADEVDGSRSRHLGAKVRKPSGVHEQNGSQIAVLFDSAEKTEP